MADHDLQKLDAMLDRLCEDILEGDEAQRLFELLDRSEVCRKRYLDTLEVHAALWQSGGAESLSTSLFSDDRHEERKTDRFGAGNSSNLRPDQAPDAIPPLSPLPSPLSPQFVGGPVFSYMVATVVLCLMLLGAWAYKISDVHDLNIAGNHRNSTTSGPHELDFVGCVTGLKDCRWANEDDHTVIGDSVSLDREYALSSGLMEITYKNGAKVILEGPCRYKVDSTTGGYLGRGKLTARINGAKPQAANPDSRNSSLILHPSSFIVTTPTAVVTDLGTEFGVKVDEDGQTAAFVFQGSVRMDLKVGDEGIKDGGLMLHESESAQTYKNTTDDDLLALRRGNLDPKQFVRRILNIPEELDLLDIVAGGNGALRHRECGIDPATGMEDRSLLSEYREASSGFRPWYRKVEWNDLVDGVFVPDGRMGKVQINSAGFCFDGFPKTDGKTYGSIWARAAKVGTSGWSGKREGWIYDLESAEQYMPKGRGLLGMHANAGITFDLAKTREEYRDARLADFRATVAMVDAHSIAAEQSADVWIFVDNRLEWHRLHLSPRDGVLNVVIKLRPGDRFLTLASTDGGNGSLNDWIVFGDPMLKTIPDDEDAKRGKLDANEKSGK